MHYEAHPVFVFLHVYLLLLFRQFSGWPGTLFPHDVNLILKQMFVL